MKTIVLILCLFFVKSVFSQRLIEVVNINTNGKIPKGMDSGCTTNTTGPVNNNGEFNYFLFSGINLVKYDWSIPTLNCQINKTYLLQRKATTNGIVGLLGGSIGAGLLLNYFLLTSISSDPTIYGTNKPQPNYSWALFSGIALIGASIPFDVAAVKNHKKKGNEMFRLMQMINALNKQ